jgi:hypothetical protein
LLSKKLTMRPGFRSQLEERIARQLEVAGVAYGYETEKLHYTVPARKAAYTPDFVFDGSKKIYIEAKGRFGHARSQSSSTAERQKLALIREQYPDIDLRIVFQNANTPIYKGSKTRYRDWAEAHGIPWADKGIIPQEWINELSDSR